MERALPMLRKIAKLHLLVVIFFENTGLVEKANKRAENIDGIYVQTIAQKAVIEKQTIAAELKKYGINTILTTPEKLNVDTINKYRTQVERVDINVPYYDFFLLKSLFLPSTTNLTGT